jgi:hypothetical protein
MGVADSNATLLDQCHLYVIVILPIQVMVADTISGQWRSPEATGDQQ